MDDINAEVVKHVTPKYSDLKQEPVLIECLDKADEVTMIEMIRRNLDSFEGASSVLAASFRRLENLYSTYSKHGSIYLVARDAKTGKCIGGAGVGPFAGLSHNEGIGEVREFFVEKPYRRQGIGSLLVKHCLEVAEKADYKRIYLETTPHMKNAQKLFRGYGFSPVTLKSPSYKGAFANLIPCYFLRNS